MVLCFDLRVFFEWLSLVGPRAQPLRYSTLLYGSEAFRLPYPNASPLSDEPAEAILVTQSLKITHHHELGTLW